MQARNAQYLAPMTYRSQAWRSRRCSRKEPGHLPAGLADAVQQGSRRGREVFAGGPVERVIRLLDGARAGVRYYLARRG